MTEIIKLDPDNGESLATGGQEPGCMDLIRRFHAAGKRYAETCFGDTLLGLHDNPKDKTLLDVVNAAKESSIAKIEPIIRCGRNLGRAGLCGNVVQIVSHETITMSPCAKYPEGIVIGTPVTPAAETSVSTPSVADISDLPEGV